MKNETKASREFYEKYLKNPDAINWRSDHIAYFCIFLPHGLIMSEAHQPDGQGEDVTAVSSCFIPLPEER